jgi:hypothetical protein
MITIIIERREELSRMKEDEAEDRGDGRRRKC